MLITRRGAIAAGSSLLAAATLPRHAGAATPVSLAYGPQTPVYALGPIAKEKGLITAEGLDLQLVVGNAGTHGRQTLAAGQAMFAHGDASHPLQLGARGKPAKIILATQMVSSISYIVVRQDLYESGIDTPEKLAAYKRPDGGKPVVAATAIGSGTWMYGTYVFESKGLGDRVNWVSGGGLSTMLPALQTKQFDAIMAVPSWVVEAESKGFGKTIFDTGNPAEFAKVFGGTLPVLVFYTLADTIEQDRPKVQAMVNALYRTLQYVKATPIDEVYALVSDKYYAGQNSVGVKAEMGFDKNTWAYDGRIDKAAFERGGRVWYRGNSDIPPARYEDVVDMSFLDAAQKQYG